MKFYIKDGYIYSDMSSKTGYFVYDDSLDIKKELSERDNKGILDLIKNVVQRKGLDYYGIIEEKKLEEIRAKIKEGKYKEVKDVEEVDFEEKTSYPEVIKQVRKKEKEDLEKFRKFYERVKEHFGPLMKREKESLENKEKERETVKSELDELENLKKREEEKINREYNNSINSIKREEKELEKKNYKWERIQKKVEKFEKKKKNLNLKLSSLKKELKILKLKKGRSNHCYTWWNIILLVITLGLVYWTSLVSCDFYINRKNRQIKKIEGRIASADIKIQEYGARQEGLPSKNDSGFKELDKKKEKAKKDKEKRLKNLEDIDKKILTKKEKLSTLDGEISSLRDSTISKINSELDNIKGEFEREIESKDEVLEKFENQTVNIEGKKVIEI